MKHTRTATFLAFLSRKVRPKAGRAELTSLKKVIANLYDKKVLKLVAAKRNRLVELYRPRARIFDALLALQAQNLGADQLCRKKTLFLKASFL